MDQARVISAPNLYVEYSRVWGPGRRSVFAALMGAPGTDHEIATRLNMKPNTVRPRRVELWRQGFLEPVDMKKMKRQRAVVWGVTDAGRDAYSALDNSQ